MEVVNSFNHWVTLNLPLKSRRWMRICHCYWIWSSKWAVSMWMTSALNKILPFHWRILVMWNRRLEYSQWCKMKGCKIFRQPKIFKSIRLFLINYREVPSPLHSLIHSISWRESTSKENTRYNESHWEKN